jgi:hypothetical protein
MLRQWFLPSDVMPFRIVVRGCYFLIGRLLLTLSTIVS